MNQIAQSEMFVKSVLCCAIETVLYCSDKHFINIFRVTRLLNQSPFDLWRVVYIYLKLYPDMPVGVANHFHEIELKIVCDHAWRTES